VPFDRTGGQAATRARSAFGKYGRSFAFEFFLGIEQVGSEKLAGIELAAFGAAGNQKRKRNCRRGTKVTSPRALRHTVSLSRLPRSARSTFPRGYADPQASADRS